MQPFQGGIGGRAEGGGGAEESERVAVDVDFEGDDRPREGGEGIGFAEVTGDLRGKLVVALVMGALRTVTHLLQ